MSIKSAYMVPHPPLIIPEIGDGRQRGIADTITAYEEVGQEIGNLKPETIILISPHQTLYQDYFHISPGTKAFGDFSPFLAGDVKMELPYDEDFTKALSTLCKEEDFPAGTKGELEPKLDHGTMVPLYFVNKYWQNYKLVRIGLAGLSLEEHYHFGELINQVIRELKREVVIIASGDLSHHLKDSGPYEFTPEGPLYDKEIMAIMGSGDFSKLLTFTDNFLRKAGECGHRSFTILAGILSHTRVAAKTLSYEGPFGVGYGVVKYTPLTSINPYVQLAKETIKTYLASGNALPLPKGLPDDFYQSQAGVFVSLKKEGQLRGCIGTILPTKDSLGEEIIQNAIEASAFDPRFLPVAPIELDKLEISVDILGPLEAITSLNQLDVKRYGVIVTKGGKRGLLLPNLEGVNSVKEQVEIAKQKAGIEEDENLKLERFEVIRHT
ncbi:MAG TPA: AmmeMemoRadiSam system protein A [Candidatus Dorea intestinavium]|nr:AmmeMemoRadiSam system protein A [Candidatus Dorea intestinavium]